MITNLNKVLGNLIYKMGGITPTEVVLQFERITDSFINSITTSSVNLYCFGLNENTEKRDTQFQTKEVSGFIQRVLPPRRVDLHYIVSALTTDSTDDLLLLWHLMAIFMKFTEFPSEVFPKDFGEMSIPIVGRIANKEERANLLELWNAFGVPPRPSLHYIITVPMDLDIAIESPLVLTRKMQFRTATTAENLRANQQVLISNERPRETTQQVTRNAHVIGSKQASGSSDEEFSDKQWVVELNQQNTEVYRTSYHIGGTVRDQSGEPVKLPESANNLSVKEIIVRLAGSAMPGCRIDRLGRFVLGNIPEGENTLLVSRWDRATGQETLLRQAKITVPAKSYDIELEE